METVDESDLDWSEYDHDETAFRRKQLGAAAGADDLGCSLYELPPGKQSWPYHYHTANAEALYVLAGEGQVRGPDGAEAVSPGTYAHFPADESGGHRVVNDGDEPLRYLMVSTMREPDVTIYPGMDKFGVFVGDPPGGDERTFHGFYDIDAAVDYWEE